MIQMEKNAQGTAFLLNGRPVAVIPAQPGCADAFEPLDEGFWRWTRTCDTPAAAMKLTLRAQYTPTYFQVPSVNYNGNGWGSGAQYYGYRCDDGTPWSYAWHRVAIPACTYTENSESAAVALFGDEKGGMSCSVYTEGEETIQELIWPEMEAPKVLYKRCWEEPIYTVMAPQKVFTGLLMVREAVKPRQQIKRLLDFSWDFFRRDVTPLYSPERVRDLDTLYFRQLYHETFEGLCGIACGMHWVESDGEFRKHLNGFEAGWVGQNISVSCLLLEAYERTGDEDLKKKALAVLDTWDREAFLKNGLMIVNLRVPLHRLDSVVNGDIPVNLDSCNLGTAATYFFRAAKICKRLGIDRPSYEKRALGLCDFAVKAMKPNGELAKSYFMDGTVNTPHGSVGCFLVLPLFDAYEVTGEKRYLAAALKGMDFYIGEFLENWATTAGALDSNCIDKESAAPVLRGAIRAYDATGDKKYLEQAEELAYYLATWQWHYTEAFPKDSLAAKAGFDTYGCTAVSAAHNALDFYGIYWVPEYIRLGELTGKKVWKERARALWYNGLQLVSDGTLVINNRVRPAGSQDESVRHTHWARPDHRCFVTSEWLTNWQGTYREIALDMLDNWDLLR